MKVAVLAHRRVGVLFAVVLATASIVGLTVGATPAGAAVFTVTTTTDGGAGSLREAVETLAVTPTGDEVVLQAGATYTLTCAQGGALTHGDTPLTITGNGATITMEASCEEHILTNGSGALVLNGVRVAGLNLQVVGISGAILGTDGPLSLQSVVIDDVVLDSAGAVFGGLFDTGGATTAVGTTITNISISATANSAVFGGITNNNGATFTDSQISDFSVSAEGSGAVFGGLFNNGGAALVRTSLTRMSVTTDAGSIFGGVSNNEGLTMTDFTITDLTTTSDSGAVFGGVGNNGGTTMVRSHFTGIAVSTSGNIFGGIASNDGLEMTDSSITDASVTTSGDGNISGGIASSDLTLVRSSIASITVDAAGDISGGVASGETASLVNSTLANVSAQADGTISGGLFEDESLTVIYATMSGLSSDSLPAFRDLELTAFGSAFGSGATCDDDVTTTSNGYNFASNTTCDLVNATDKQGDTLNPLFGALAYNGGTAGLTLLPLAGSPLIDAIAAAACQSGGATGITTDERGFPRPSAASPNCDIGAVEVQPVAVVITPTFTG